MASLHDILKRYWGYDSFRPGQEAIIQSILSGKDTLALLPTGGGKSICYQVPALAQPGICLVVSPLIALMKDQVEGLKKRGIGALVIHSGMSRRDVVLTLENARQDYFKFLYVSPERLETSLFKEYLPALNINLLAVDEAHCVSQWGYDFRPSYLRIAALREELRDVPVLAVTASATPAVQRDIQEKLLFKNSRLFTQSFERPNLSYSVFAQDVKPTKLVEIFKKVAGCGIVYCKSRKRTVEVAGLLQMHGLSADYYHAGLSAEERSRKQQQWIDNKVRVIVCTNAFGMGIDKPDVRVVVHVDVPDCLEGYYQEAGRCGRDGAKAFAVLLFTQKDATELEALHATRYPSLEVIRQVYEALVNHLQIPLHGGQDTSYVLRMDDFVRAFKLNVHQALYALQALEGDGWLEYNEKNFTPSTLCFTTSKEGLYEFYKSYPQHEALLVTLLRTYEGIFDFPVFVSEALLAKLTKTEEQNLKDCLQRIAGYGIIRYNPQANDPHIIFRKQRVAATDLRINLAAYEQRKAAFVKRVAAMVGYLRSTTCRSQIINTYFGDATATACGVCDNCLAQRKLELTADELTAIDTTIRSHLQQRKLTAEQLVAECRGIHRDKLWQALRFLQAEKKIIANSAGLLQYAH